MGKAAGPDRADAGASTPDDAKGEGARRSRARARVEGAEGEEGDGAGAPRGRGGGTGRGRRGAEGRAGAGEDGARQGERLGRAGGGGERPPRVLLRSIRRAFALRAHLSRVAQRAASLSSCSQDAVGSQSSPSASSPPPFSLVHRVEPLSQAPRRPLSLLARARRAASAMPPPLGARAPGAPAAPVASRVARPLRAATPAPPARLPGASPSPVRRAHARPPIAACVFSPLPASPLRPPPPPPRRSPRHMRAFSTRVCGVERRDSSGWKGLGVLVGSGAASLGARRAWVGGDRGRASRNPCRDPCSPSLGSEKLTRVAGGGREQGGERAKERRERAAGFLSRRFRLFPRCICCARGRPWLFFLTFPRIGMVGCIGRRACRATSPQRRCCGRSFRFPFL